MIRRLLVLFAGCCVTVLFSGCAAPTKQIDYSAFKASRPHSILVLPPLNESPDIRATYSVLSQVTYPLAEAGYYVLPVAVVDETFRQNGLTVPADIHEVKSEKLRQIFGADAALYLAVSEYGSRYMVISSVTTVAVKAKLVDLRSGDTLWTGTAQAANDSSANSSGGVIGMLLNALVTQVINQSTDAAYGVAGMVSIKLLSAGQPAGILYGPRSPKYGSD